MYKYQIIDIYDMNSFTILELSFDSILDKTLKSLFRIWWSHSIYNGIRFHKVLVNFRRVVDCLV